GEIACCTGSETCCGFRCVSCPEGQVLNTTTCACEPATCPPGRSVCVGSEASGCCAACEVCTEFGNCVDDCNADNSCTRCDPALGQCVNACGRCQRCGEEGICVDCAAGPSPGCCRPDGSCLVCAPDEIPDCAADPPICRAQG